MKSAIHETENGFYMIEECNEWYNENRSCKSKYGRQHERKKYNQQEHMRSENTAINTRWCRTVSINNRKMLHV